MRTRRSNFEIYVEVLTVINDGVNKPTLIMNKCHLLWRNTLVILDNMINEGLIECRLSQINNKSKKLYYITNLGEVYINKALKLKSVIKT